MLPSNILWHIWQYVGSKSYFLDKELISIIQHKRTQFVERPLRIYYTLYRWKQKNYRCDDGSVMTTRPSMYPENIRFIDISGGAIGKIYNKKYIRLSQKIKDKIIPLSSLYESSNGFNLKVIYWTIYKSWSDDKRLFLYNILHF